MNTQVRMNMVVFVCIALASLCYFIVGIIGYISFGDDIKDNILMNCKFNRESTCPMGTLKHSNVY